MYLLPYGKSRASCIVSVEQHAVTGTWYWTENWTRYGAGSGIGRGEGRSRRTNRTKVHWWLCEKGGMNNGDRGFSGRGGGLVIERGERNYSTSVTLKVGEEGHNN